MQSGHVTSSEPEQSKVDVQSFTAPLGSLRLMKTFQGRQQEFKNERMIS